MAEQPVPESVAKARQAVVDARKDVEKQLDDLGLATRAALDIPAKVRRNPVRTVGVGAGAAFLLLGGPKRVMKRVEQQLFPKRRYRRLTPTEIDRAVDRLGEEDQEATRAHLERDFATYLEKEHPKEQPNARRSFWGTYDTVVGIVGAAAARELVKRFISVPQEARKEVAQEDAKANVAEAKADATEAKAATTEAKKERAKAVTADAKADAADAQARAKKAQR
jgi:hypothetical protein